MKILLKVSASLCFFLLAPQVSNGQLLKKLTKKAKNKIEREAENRAENRINKKIDEEFDKAEDAIDGKETKKDSVPVEGKDASILDSSDKGKGQSTKEGPTVIWNRFDFVPGDKVIFEDGPDASEEIGEFPSRWDLHNGNSEIMEVDGNLVVGFPQGGTIVPYLKNSKEDYLPEIFTIELDVYFRAGGSRRVWIDLFDKKNQRNTSQNKTIQFHVNSAEFEASEGTYPNKTGNYEEFGGWRHLSIAFTKGKLKLYIDDTRLINIPHYKGNPTGITLEIDGYAADTPKDIQYVKNFRIAKGGVKYYDKVLSDGKIIVNGIKFDVNKASLKPESMGPINTIYKLMQKQTELNFSVEGHTDSDGGEDANMTLSQARGKAVMDRLIEMGIAKDRLRSNGFGESMPIDNNNTPEGKANNRRVEFVKF